MKFTRYLILGASFLLVVSSALSLLSSTPHDKDPVYVNIAAIVCLTVALVIMNFDKHK